LRGGKQADELNGKDCLPAQEQGRCLRQGTTEVYTGWGPPGVLRRGVTTNAEKGGKKKKGHLCQKGGSAAISLKGLFTQGKGGDGLLARNVPPNERHPMPPQGKGTSCEERVYNEGGGTPLKGDPDRDRGLFYREKKPLHFRKGEEVSLQRVLRPGGGGGGGGFLTLKRGGKVTVHRKCP